MRSKEAIVRQLSGTARQLELPPPTGGLNTRDSRSAMAPNDAVVFTNMVSESGGVKSRLGYSVFSNIGITGNVGFLKEYINNTTLKMVVGAGASLYSLPAAGGTATTLGSGYSNVQFMGARMGTRLVMVNGANGPLQFNGSAVSGSAGLYTGDIATPGANTMDGIHTHKNRLYMWDSESGDFFYGSTNTFQGAFAKFSLSNISATGGNLLMMQTITRDGGNGADDYAVFILSTGETLVYEGSNPGNASDWALVGRYFIPPPVSKRSSAKIGGDVLVLTEQDVVSLTQVMQNAFDEQGAVVEPSKIAGGIAADYATYGGNSGWELVLYGKRGWAIVNVPETTNSTYHQYVITTTTKAPSYFDGWDAFTFGVFNNRLFFGGNGIVYQADNGTDDNGATIQCRAQQAFSVFDIPNIKNVKNVTITYISDVSISLGAEVAYDYQDITISNLSSSETTGAEWDDAEWDDADWAGAAQVRNTKFSAAGTGRSVSVALGFNIKGAQFTWMGTSISFDIQAMI